MANNDQTTAVHELSDHAFEIYVKFDWGQNDLPVFDTARPYDVNFEIGDPGTRLDDQPFALQGGSPGPQGRVTLCYVNGHFKKMLISGLSPTGFDNAIKKLRIWPEHQVMEYAFRLTHPRTGAILHQSPVMTVEKER